MNALELTSGTQGERRRDGLWVFCALVCVLALSLFSGFHARPTPREIAWAFSPLGWLEIGWREMWLRWGELGTARLFHGELGLTLDYFWVYLKTCAMEAPFYLSLLVRRHGWRRSVGWLFIANALTHPAVYFLIPVLIPSYIVSSIASEIFAPGVEIAFVWVVSRPLDRGRVSVRWVGATIVLVGLANLVSWQLGGFV